MEGHLHLLLPSLMRLVSPASASTPLDVRRQVLKSLKRLLRMKRERVREIYESHTTPDEALREQCSSILRTIAFHTHSEDAHGSGRGGGNAPIPLTPTSQVF